MEGENEQVKWLCMNEASEKGIVARITGFVLLALLLCFSGPDIARAEITMFQFNLEEGRTSQVFSYQAPAPGTILVNAIWSAQVELELEMLQGNMTGGEVAGSPPLQLRFQSVVADAYTVRIGTRSGAESVNGIITVQLVTDKPKPGRGPEPPPPEPPPPPPPDPPQPPEDPPEEPPQLPPDDGGLLPPVPEIIEVGGTGRPSPKVKVKKPEAVSIVIKVPANNDQYTYLEENLMIPLLAEVKPTKYAKSVRWYVDKTGNIALDKGGKVTPAHNPNGAADYLDYDSYPVNNDDFGEKVIMAEVPGKATATPVKIEVFFDPLNNGHPPGRGQPADTPNWFYYWGQTRAGAGVQNDLKYTSRLTAVNNTNDLVIARFDPSDSKIFLSDLVFSENNDCTDRVLWATASTGTAADAARMGITVQPATKIDCFGEIIMHEWQHRKEFYMWQGKEDKDLDGVPHEVEAITLQCKDDDLSTLDLAIKSKKRDDSWYSCFQRPFRRVTDREIYAYYQGWKWPVGKADKEDWSWCGKQWKDRTHCTWK